MARNYFNSLAIILFFALFLFACTKPKEKNNCLSYKKTPVSNIEGANAASVNQEVILKVLFGCINGCGQFGDFEETIAGNTYTIDIKVKYAGCVCTQDVPTRTALYKFKPSKTGTYVLKFSKQENSYLYHTIVVQ